MSDLAGERWGFSTDLTPVESSVIRSVRYDRSQKLLEIAFKNGHVYQYVNVPPDVYDRFLTSGSKGQFFNDVIRYVYPYWRFHPLAKKKT